MRFANALELLLVHCQGEIGKVIVGGAPEIPGSSIVEKMSHINEVDDGLRRFVTFEPRAHAAQSVNLLLPPTRPDADAAFIVLQADRAHPDPDNVQFVGGSAAAVPATPDPVFGERACAFVVAKPGSRLDLNDLTGFLRTQRIASFKLPERLELVDHFPTSLVGKILKRQLRDQIAARLQQEAAETATA